MAYLTVDIDLDEIKTRDLIDELENRYLDERDQDYLIKMIKNNDGSKLDLFLKNKDNYTLLELEEMFKEKFTHEDHPKEQLTLEL